MFAANFSYLFSVSVTCAASVAGITAVHNNVNITKSVPPPGSNNESVVKQLKDDSIIIDAITPFIIDKNFDISKLAFVTSWAEEASINALESLISNKNIESDKLEFLLFYVKNIKNSITYKQINNMIKPSKNGNSWQIIPTDEKNIIDKNWIKNTVKIFDSFYDIQQALKKQQNETQNSHIKKLKIDGFDDSFNKDSFKTSLDFYLLWKEFSKNENNFPFCETYLECTKIVGNKINKSVLDSLLDSQKLSSILKFTVKIEDWLKPVEKIVKPKEENNMMCQTIALQKTKIQNVGLNDVVYKLNDGSDTLLHCRITKQ